MAVQRSKKEFPFRSYQGAEPKVEELQEEIEALYKYLADEDTRIAKEVDRQLAVHDEVLVSNGELVFDANGDVVMVTGIPNS